MNLEPREHIRIAIIVPALRQLGPVKVMQTLVGSLSEVKELRLKVFYIDKTIDSEVKFSVPVERLDRSAFPFAEYDIVHTNGIRPDFFAWMKRRKIKFHISTIHNFVFDDLSSTYNRLISLMFGNLWLFLWKKSDKLVCVSESTKKYYGHRFPASKLEVIHNGITNSDESTKPDYDIINSIKSFRSNQLKVLGSAGILTKRKGIEQVLYLLEKNRELAFVLIGDGKELHNLKILAAKLRISDRIYFCGFRNTAVSYFKYFDYFIMPSRSEGFGLALIEAVQQKVPVICSGIPVFKEIFNSNEVTFFMLDDINSLNEALKESSVSGADKAILAHDRFQNHYTDKQMAKRYLELYQSAS